MLWIYIKNYLKMMVRKRWIILLMIVFPLLLIAALSSVFGDFMNRNIQLEEVNVGYTITEEASYMATYLEDIMQENKVTLEKVNINNKEEMLRDEKIVAFIELQKDGYIIYKTSSHPLELAVIENICYSYFQQIQLGNTVLEDIDIQVEQLDIEPLPSAIDYYGIIEIIYFTWFGFMTLTSILSVEKKYKIMERIHVTAVSKTTMYLAKFLPATIICFVEMIIGIILSNVFFGVHWGNIALSLIVVLLSVMAAMAFSLMVFNFCKQILLGTAIMYFVGFAMGFLGGSFQMYMFAPYAESIKKLSPIYYTNRSLIEFSTSGSSEYFLPCVGILVTILLLCSSITIIKMYREEGRV